MGAPTIPVTELHINWLVQLMEIEERLTKWEQGFVADLALKIEEGDQNKLWENQEAKLRQIAFDYLAAR